MTYRKKLIEVALPLEAINVASAREKSIRHGHPSTLHLWWARRPLAACRAVLFASLVDDPSSDPMFGGDEDIEASKRAELFNLIEELVLWENSNNPRVINKARAEIARCIASRKIETGELKKDQAIQPPQDAGGKACKKYTPHDIKHMLASPEAVNHFLATYGPPVLDPFCGGGSIPLEAQRLGLPSRGADLNPVPVLITKALIEIPSACSGVTAVNSGNANSAANERQRSIEGTGVAIGAKALAADLRYYGKKMRDEAERQLGSHYPRITITEDTVRDRPDVKDYAGQKLIVIAWLWTRTVASPDPSCRGTHVPLVRSWWISKKKGNEAYIRPVVDKARNAYCFEVYSGKPKDGFNPNDGTVNRNGATCLLTGTHIPLEYIRREGKANGLGARLLAVVVEGKKGRIYLPGTEEQERIALAVKGGQYPDTDLPQQALGFRVQLYGMDKHRKLFTARQLKTITTLSDLVAATGEAIRIDRPGADEEYIRAVLTYLALAVSRFTMRCSSLAAWDSTYQKIQNVFGRQAISMVWDFAEGNPFCDSTGNFSSCYEAIAAVLDRLLPELITGTVLQRDATQMAPDGEKLVVSTDPPYYDNIGYADLSDYFYVWLRRCLNNHYPELFSTLLTPKAQELIAASYRHNGDMGEAKKFFEEGLSKTFGSVCQYHDRDYPLTVFYAFGSSGI